ncbi:MAG TPA: TIGR01777 family oxidoreductase [Verrucomicrobiae bacterium]|nr:TIGR01777 family oxidoreductase [Verrucomicrobiae bacterium]
MNAPSPKRVVIAGGTGFIGRALTSALRARNYSVTVLTRQPRRREDGVEEIAWQPDHIGGWSRCLDGAAALVNLAGHSIHCRHTPENLRFIRQSRLQSVATLAAALQQTPHPPRVWVQAGAVGIYGDRGDEWCDETSRPGQGALAEVCRAWEETFFAASTPGTRRALLRLGMVLGRNGGALPVLEKLTKWFLGGRAGGGRQFVSWIHLADLTRVAVTALEREDWPELANAVAPHPVTNAEFMRHLRRALHRPWSPPAPVWAVKLGARLLGTEPSLVLTGCRCAPKRLLEAGFQFQFPDLPSAFQNFYGSDGAGRERP